MFFDFNWISAYLSRKFTALSQNQRERVEEILNQEVQQPILCAETAEIIHNSQTTSRITRSEIQCPKPAPRTGVFWKVCLFCGKKGEKNQRN